MGLNGSSLEIYNCNEKGEMPLKKFKRENNSSMESNFYLQLCICPARNLNDHVENARLFVGVERNVMEGRDDFALSIFYKNVSH
jgi:hypothetical protein